MQDAVNEPALFQLECRPFERLTYVLCDWHRTSIAPRGYNTITCRTSTVPGNGVTSGKGLDISKAMREKIRAWFPEENSKSKKRPQLISRRSCAIPLGNSQRQNKNGGFERLRESLSTARMESLPSSLPKVGTFGYVSKPKLPC
jgi:hypothetical protein